MFPKLIKNAKLEDIQRENPTLLESIKNSMKEELSSSLKDEIAATLQVTHSEQVESLEAQVAQLNNNVNILTSGIKCKQGDLALQLVSEGKTEEEAVAAINGANVVLEKFEGSAPAPAGAGSAIDSQSVDTKEKAIEFVMQKNPNVTHAQAIKMARRQFPDLFVSKTLTTFTKESR